VFLGNSNIWLIWIAAISALVESHGARTTGASRPRPGDIPPVTLTQIPKIKPSAFASYLSLAPEYDQYQRAKDRGLEEHLRLSKTTEGTLSPVPSIAEQTVIADDASSIKSVKRRRPNLAVAPLQTVPRVYFDENFRLENPRTFDVVSERSEVIRSTVPASQGENGAVAQAAPSQRKALATNAILQEKLSWYMDTVEVHLISSISTASSSFFAALGDLRELHSEASASVHKIQALRKELVRLDEEQAVKGLEIVRLRRRRDNVAKLERAVKQIEQVTLGVQHAEKSLEHHEIETALDAIVETERLLAGEGEGLVDLRGVRSLEAVMADLNHLRHRIGKAYEARFVQCLLDDLRFHVERVPSSETLRRFAQSFQREQYQRFLTSQQRTNFFPPPRSSSLPPEFAVLSDSLRNLLKQYLDGLQRANHINDAVQAYRDAVIKEAKNLIRRNLPSEGDADSVASNISHISRMSRSGGIRQSSADKSQALTRALRALGPADAEDLLVKIYTGVSELIRRLGSQQKMLLDVTMQMGETGVGGMLSPRLEQNGFQNDFPGEMQRSRSESDPTISMDISDLISSAVDISQSHIVKLVKVRTEQVAHYPPDMFLRYFTLTRLFAQECEAVSVRVGPGLQNAVSNQIRDFLSAYQDDRIRNLAECLENDKWAAKEFEPERQQSLDRILKAATADPEEWVGIGRLWEIRAREQGETIKLPPPPSETDDVPLNGTAAQTMAEPPKRLTHALVDDQKFILPESGLLVLTEIESYLRLVVNMPGVTQELGSNILQFLQVSTLLSTFRERKNILTHLSLALQLTHLPTNPRRGCHPFGRPEVHNHQTPSDGISSALHNHNDNTIHPRDAASALFIAEPGCRLRQAQTDDARVPRRDPRQAHQYNVGPSTHARGHHEGDELGRGLGWRGQQVLYGYPMPRDGYTLQSPQQTPPGRRSARHYGARISGLRGQTRRRCRRCSRENRRGEEEVPPVPASPTDYLPLPPANTPAEWQGTPKLSVPNSPAWRAAVMRGK